MSGTHAGGLKVAITNKKRYGEDYYRNIGRKGGSVSRGGGFTGKPKEAREAGAMGGRRSRKGLTFLREEGDEYVYESKKTGEIVRRKK